MKYSATAYFSIAAILGSLLFMKDIRVVTLTFLALGYMLPYVATLQLYYRNQVPVEPILFALAGLFLGFCMQKVTHLRNRSTGDDR